MTAVEVMPTVLVMLKAPRVGDVKTRLARDVGATAAVEIYRRLVERQMAAIPREWMVEVHFAPADAGGELRGWLESGPAYYPQVGADLGERLIHATAGAFARGARKLIVVGGDCPGLDTATLCAAATELGAADVVLGPAMDGGYYLIGLREPRADLFRGIAWSSSTVLASTLSRIEENKLSHAMLGLKEDVDDLASWQRAEPLLTSAAPPRSDVRR